MPKNVTRTNIPAKRRDHAELVRWQKERMPFLIGAENSESFFKRVAMFLPTLDPRYVMIRKAYRVAKRDFKNKWRDSGARYFEHLRAVALILLEYLEVRDYQLIVAALLHDIVEDTDWSIEMVREEFGDEVALLIEFLSMPKNEFFSKEEAEHAYHARLENAPRSVLLIKLADRLHNLLTLCYRPREKQVAKIKETERHYVHHARDHQILLPEIREVLQILRSIAC